MKKLKQIAAMAVAAVGMMAAVFTAAPAMAVECPAGSAQPTADTLAGCSIAAEHKDDDLMKRVQQIINVVLGVLGLVAVIVIIIGGFYYITSSGDAAKLAKAKNTILYGIIGLIIALLAYAIVNFVLKSVFS